MTQTKGPYYLIIAKYNHDQYGELAKLTQAGGYQDEDVITKTRNIARDLFGFSYESAYGDSSDYTPGETQKSSFKWAKNVAFLGSFPYYRTDIDLEKGSHLYGWIAIVAASSFDDLKESEFFQRMGYPNSEFCQLYDMHISQIGRDISPDLYAGLTLAATPLDLEKDRNPEAWSDRAIKVYEDQTPAMWAW